MEDSIFTKIIKGEIPCHKVYEDDVTLAFLDIHPAAEGHTLVIPKQQVKFVWDLDEVTYQSLMRTVRNVGQRLSEVYSDRYVGELVVGVDVPHAHVHLIPFVEPSEIQAAFSSSATEPDHDVLAKVAEKLYFS